MSSIDQILEKELTVAFQLAPELNDIFPDGQKAVAMQMRELFGLTLSQATRFSTVDMMRVLHELDVAAVSPDGLKSRQFEKMKKEALTFIRKLFKRALRSQGMWQLLRWEDEAGQPQKSLHIANIRSVVMARLGVTESSIQQNPEAFQAAITKIRAQDLRDWGLEQVITKNPFFNSHFDALVESFSDFIPLTRDDFETLKRFTWKTPEEAAQNTRTVVTQKLGLKPCEKHSDGWQEQRTRLLKIQKDDMVAWKLGGGFINTHKLFTSHIGLLVHTFGDEYDLTEDDFKTDLSWKNIDELHENVRTVVTRIFDLKPCNPNTPLWQTQREKILSIRYNDFLDSGLRSAFDTQSSPYRSYADALVGAFGGFYEFTREDFGSQLRNHEWQTKEQIHAQVFWTIVQKLGLKGCEMGDETHMKQRKMITGITRKNLRDWGLMGAYNNKFYQSHLDLLYDIFEDFYVLTPFSFSSAKRGRAVGSKLSKNGKIR